MEVKIKKFLLIIAPAVLVGLIIRFIFNIDGLDSLWSLMTISFFFFFLRGWRHIRIPVQTGGCSKSVISDFSSMGSGFIFIYCDDVTEYGGMGMLAYDIARF